MMGWTGLIVLRICDKLDFLQKGDPNTQQSQHYPPGDVELLWPERRYLFYLMLNKGDK